MAYAKRLQIEYDDINSVATRIEIWQEGYAGAVVTRNYASGQVCCETKWGDQGSKKLPLVYGSEVTLYFDSETDFEFFDFFTSNSRKNKILVYKNGSLFHASYGEADTWSEPFSYPPYEVSFTGYDGLGLLKEEDFLSSSKEYYEGEMTPLAIIALVLEKTGFDLNINTAVSIRPDGALTSADPLTQVLKDVYTYRDLNCYEVLEALLRGCRIMQRNGQWWIVANDLWGNSSIDFYTYTSAGVASGTQTKNTRFTGFWMEGDGELSFMPAMKQMTVIQDYGYLGNVIKNNNFLSFEDGVFESWTAVGITPAQRLYDGNGNRYVYLEGAEYTYYVDTPRTKYLRSEAIRLEASASIATFTLDYALVNALRQPGVVLIGIHFLADDGTHYNLKLDLDKTTSQHEIIHVWEETSSLYAVPCEDKEKIVRGSNNNYAIGQVSEGWPLDEVTEHFQTKSIQIKEGIPKNGQLTVYLFLPYTLSVADGGACFRNVEFKFLDKDTEEEPPVETEFTVVNDLGNNYTPADLTIINGSLPNIDNRLAIYAGGFILNDGSGAAVDDWKWDGSSVAYGYAQLIARYVAAEFKLARLVHQSVMADTIPSVASVWYDDATDKYFLEAGIVYNDRMQSTEGRYIEVVAFDIDSQPVSGRPRYNDNGGRRTTGINRTGTIRNSNDEAGLYDDDFNRVNTTGRLSSREFTDITDADTGRTVLQQTINRIVVDQESHDFAIGEALRYDSSTDLYVRAQADSEANAEVIGIVSDIYDTDSFAIKTGGIVPDGSFLPGVSYVLSPTVAGAVVEKSTVTTWPEGSVAVKMGTGSSEGLSVNIDRYAGWWNDKTWEVYIDFEAVEAFTYTCPYALKFTAMNHEQTNAPTLSVALNTNMAQYDDLVITPDEVGLVTLIGTKL